MSDLESRLLVVERESARLGARMEDVAKQLNGLGGVPVDIARAHGEITGLVEDITAIRTDIASINQNLTSRDKQATDERRSLRIALVSLTAVIGAAIVSAIGAIVAAGFHP